MDDASADGQRRARDARYDAAAVVTELFAPVCSITTTKRRRFFWAAWWSAPPCASPFRKPDASDGGAATFDEARAAAEAAAGRPLIVTEPAWARAWLRILRGQPAWTGAASLPKGRTRGDDRGTEAPREPTATPAPSIWEVLGVPSTVSEAALRNAFRQRAMETHPDRGGDATAFRRVLAAYEEARRRRRRPRRKGG
jgi:hypothetical protein